MRLREDNPTWILKRLYKHRYVVALLKSVKSNLANVGNVFLAFLGSFFIGGLIIWMSGNNPFEAYAAMAQGLGGGVYSLAATLSRFLPIVGTGIAAALALNGGLFNLGCEGQLALGGLGAAIVCLYPQFDSAIVILLALVVSMLAGGLWGLLSGWLQIKFGAPILITSFLMNYPATYFLSYMIIFQLREAGSKLNQTPMIAKTFRLSPLLPGTTLHAGIFIVAIIIISVAFFLRNTVSGYELRILGSNREFAIASGINVPKLILMTMLVSGMIAGISGSLQVLGVQYRLIDSALTGPGYAWSGWMAAVLANNNPIGTVVASFFFAALQTGASNMERVTRVPYEMALIQQAIIVLAIVSREIFRSRMKETT